MTYYGGVTVWLTAYSIVYNYLPYCVDTMSLKNIYFKVSAVPIVNVFGFTGFIQGPLNTYMLNYLNISDFTFLIDKRTMCIYHTIILG